MTDEERPLTVEEFDIMFQSVQERTRTAVRPSGTKSARIETVIVTEAKKGYGLGNDPSRIVRQYWDFEGNLLAEYDPYGKKEEEWFH